MALFRRLRECGVIFWYLMPELFRMSWGVWKLSRLPRPRVSIFGGSRVPYDGTYSKQAMELSGKLITHNISVITGGGPGIMQAANCGASPDIKGPLRSIGITVKGLDEKQFAKCTQELIATKYFWSRKWLLTFYSDAFVVFPGGFGTLDEIGEITTLVQTKKLAPQPIVLMDREYWAPLLAWVERAEKEGLLKEEDKNILHVTDSVDEALHIVHSRCELLMRLKPDAPSNKPGKPGNPH